MLAYSITSIIFSYLSFPYKKSFIWERASFWTDKQANSYRCYRLMALIQINRLASIGFSQRGRSFSTERSQHCWCRYNRLHEEMIVSSTTKCRLLCDGWIMKTLLTSDLLWTVSCNCTSLPRSGTRYEQQFHVTNFHSFRYYFSQPHAVYSWLWMHRRVNQLEVSALYFYPSLLPIPVCVDLFHLLKTQLKICKMYCRIFANSTESFIV